MRSSFQHRSLSLRLAYRPLSLVWASCSLARSFARARSYSLRLLSRAFGSPTSISPRSGRPIARSAISPTRKWIASPYPASIDHRRLGNQLHRVSFSAAVGALLSGIGESWQRRDLAIGVGIVICAVFLFGEWRLRSTPATQSVTVTLMAKDVPMSVYLGSEQQALTLLREYADEIRRATPAGTQVIVLPEKIARVPDSALPEVDALFSSAAVDTHSAIVLGLVRRTATVAFNESRFYSSRGKAASELRQAPPHPADRTREAVVPLAFFSTNLPGDGDYKSARTWIFLDLVGSMAARVRACSWSRRGTSRLTPGCTVAWLSYARSKMVLLLLARRATDT